MILHHKISSSRLLANSSIVAEFKSIVAEFKAIVARFEQLSDRKLQGGGFLCDHDPVDGVIHVLGSREVGARKFCLLNAGTGLQADERKASS